MKIILNENNKKFIDLFPIQNDYLLEMPQVIFKGVLNKYKVWFYDTDGNSKGINPNVEDKSIKSVHVHISRLKDYNFR